MRWQYVRARPRAPMRARPRRARARTRAQARRRPRTRYALTPRAWDPLIGSGVGGMGLGAQYRAQIPLVLGPEPRSCAPQLRVRIQGSQVILRRRTDVLRRRTDVLRPPPTTSGIPPGWPHPYTPYEPCTAGDHPIPVRIPIVQKGRLTPWDPWVKRGPKGVSHGHPSGHPNDPNHPQIPQIPQIAPPASLRMPSTRYPSYEPCTAGDHPIPVRIPIVPKGRLAPWDPWVKRGPKGVSQGQPK